MTRPLFSVIIPTYGRQKYLAEAVASVLAQTVTDYECIIVDDASPVPAVGPDDARFRVVRRDRNGGQGAALNTGLREARGRNVVFLDDDDLYHPERLELALEGLRHGSIGVCQMRLFGEGVRARDCRENWHGDLAGSIRERYAPQIGTAAVERARALLFDEELRACADGEWWLRMAQGNTFHTVPRVGLLYRVHATLRHNSNKAGRVEALATIYRKHQAYFEGNRRARAFHFRRVALNAMEAGMVSTSCRMFFRSFRTRPSLRLLGTAVGAWIRHVRA